MKKGLFCIFLFFPLGLHAFEKDDIKGYWYHFEKKGVSVSKVYAVSNCYESFCFMYTNAGVVQENDAGNPDKSKRRLSMKGVIFLYDLAPAEEKGSLVWEGGRLYNPRDGRAYKAKASLSEDGKALNVRVSLDAKGLLGMTLKWIRVSDPAALALYEKEAALAPVSHPLR